MDDKSLPNWLNMILDILQKFHCGTPIMLGDGSPIATVGNPINYICRKFDNGPKWNNPKGFSINWSSRELNSKGNWPKVPAVSSGGDLTGWSGEKPKELNWSSLAGTCSLLYYYYGMCMLDLLKYRLSMWQHVLGACIKHSHEMEVGHEVTAWRWQNGREEKRGITMHCTEVNGVRSAWGMAVK